MNSTKASTLISMQIEKLMLLNKDTYQAWQTQTASYLKDIFGSDSEEYEFINNFSFILSYDDSPYNSQIKLKTPIILTHLENCIESLEHRGLIKPKQEGSKDSESWTKKYPLIFEIVKAIIILLVGYFFRVITEPKHNQVDNKTNTEQSPNK